MRGILEAFSKLRIYGPGTFLRFLTTEIKSRLITRYFKGSYSQNGEDLVIDRLLGYKREGFYVDIGAYDPYRFSNTQRFYKRGWRGINIEPDANNFQKFRIQRRRDINLNMGIGDGKSQQTFYKFIPDTLSTFSKKECERYLGQGYKLVGKVKVPLMRLSDVLTKYSKGKEIDFMTIDTEGYELEVLATNDWRKFRPHLICVEAFEHNKNGKSVSCALIDSLLARNGYKKVFENGLNAIFERK